ncbi:hypothetical protein FLA_2009 [Filimonas lacunae]|nr:hypothetical protein FLA_2009 [Filimonas lacunae]
MVKQILLCKAVSGRYSGYVQYEGILLLPYLDVKMCNKIR